MEEEKKRMAAVLRIDGGDSPMEMMERTIEENPVVVFSRPSCCMCHVMKTLLSMVGVKVVVIELKETEVEADGAMMPETVPEVGRPVMFIGGERIGGLEPLMAMHLSGQLVPRLREVGANFDYIGLKI